MKQTKLNIISALLLLIAVGLGQNAQATTKTVTYTLNRVSQGGNDYLQLIHSGDTPFDGNTIVQAQQMTNCTYATFNLPDGFTFTFTWGSGATITSVGTSYLVCINANVRFQLNWEIPHRYVTNVKVTDDQGTASTLNGGGSATTTFTYIEQGDVSYTLAQGVAFARLVITYADAPGLSVFQSADTDTYNINSKADMRHLADYVNNGKQSCTGLTFLQTQDIACDNTYTPIAHRTSNSDETSFNGTYDGLGNTVSGITANYSGDYVGMFGYNTGTIRNVVLASSTFTGYSTVGGIVGRNDGTVENCRVESSVNINAARNGSSNHGGIAGESSGLVIGCISAATVSTPNEYPNSLANGGIVGYNKTGGVRNCLYTGTNVSVKKYKGAIVGFDEDNKGTFTNNYYTNINLGGVNGSDQNGARRARTVTLGENVTLVGDETIYNYSGITAIGTGNYALSYNDGTTTTIYSGEGQTLTLSYTGLADGYTAIYSVNGTAIEGNTFQMPAANVTVSAEIYKSDYITHWQAGPLHDGSSSEKAYIITSPDGLQLLASEVNGTDGYTANEFEGKYFKLGGDIDMSSVANFTPIGDYTNNRYFKGNFNGDGHTISHLTIYLPDIDNVGLFGALNQGGVVSQVTLDQANITGKTFVGGIAGRTHSSKVYISEINNCHVVNSTITTIYSSYIGAIIGRKSSDYNILSNNTYHSTLVFANSTTGNAFNIGIGNENDSNGACLDATQLFLDGSRTDLNELMAAYNNPANYTAHNGTAPDLSGLTATVRGDVTIPSGIVLKAPTVNISTGGRLTLADGAELICNNPVQDVIVQKHIAPYTTDNDGWNLFAMPFNAGLNPTLINGLIPSDTNTVYDLYRLKENTTCWENYKQHKGDFCIRPILGDGACLYATSVGTTLQKDGQIYPNTVEGDTAYLNKQGEGWNLIANPYTFKAYVNKPFLRMNAEGSALVPVANYWETPLNVCEGIVVKADSIFEPVIFTHTAPQAPAPSGSKGSLQIALSQPVPEPVERAGVSTGSTTGTLDKAIVSFNEGSQLGKFYFGEQDANIYLPQGGKEYAIVSVGGGRDGVHTVSTEIPVNFKAKKNGEYTISVNPEGVTFGYLHLIDNMTGANIDLLATPSYTFTAKTTDYASRFKLVFDDNASAGSASESEKFAFISNGEIIVNGEGTLQVIDALGRILFTKENTTANCQLLTSNYKPGVYVLRLINGEDVKTQKIIIN